MLIAALAVDCVGVFVVVWMIYAIRWANRTNAMVCGNLFVDPLAFVANYQIPIGVSLHTLLFVAPKVFQSLSRRWTYISCSVFCVSSATGVGLLDWYLQVHLHGSPSLAEIVWWWPGR